MLKPSTLEESPEKSASRSRSWISSCLSSLSMALSILTIWLVPILGLFFWLGSKAMPFRVGLFFGKVAVLSFGGAYAALSYVSLHASGDWGWLSSREMLDGLALAETTPGPLLIALQFVAFLGCYKAPGILSPLFSATLGSLVAVWSLFLPSFLWIFSLAPHLEGIARNPRMAGALAAIGAVVTAVITCLALWFSEALFLPAGRFAALPLVLAMIAFRLLQSKKAGVVPIILLCGIANVLIRITVLP